MAQVVDFNTRSIADYKRFLTLKRVPSYSWKGLQAIVPDEYASLIGDTQNAIVNCEYSPSNHCFDYQRDIAATAIRKRKYAVFADCGMGKTIIQFEVLKHILNAELDGKVLLVAPLMVVRQTVSELAKWYGREIGVDVLRSHEHVQSWCESNDGERVGITNYESFRDDVRPGNLIGLFLDESSMLKSHYGKWGLRLIKLGRGLRWKLAMTGTPAPNDRIEYANHAVFLDHCRTTNEFLARYFINRGQTQNRWEIKPHALGPFYRDLSHWCIFLSDPSVYGWSDNCHALPPIHVHREHVELTDEQRKAVQDLTGTLMVSSVGGIGQRSKLQQIAKGKWKKAPIPTRKPEHIANSIDSWKGESSIVWCHYNDEQDLMERTLPQAGSITGSTPYQKRCEIIDAFQSGEITELISKPSILGFGLNLQVATRQVFNGLTDSYEDYYQAVKRSNRIGSTKPLNVHLPATEIEEPMIANVLRKADRVESDTREQERMFRANAIGI